MENSQSGIRQHEVWRLEYRQRRYLRLASEDALDQRFRDVFNNLMTLTPEGKVGILPVTEAGVWWMTLFTHLLEEYELRGRGLPVHRDAPVKPTAPHLPRSAKVEIPEPRRALVKAGKRVYMQELYEKGRLRVAAASSYGDPSLNLALKDDELKFDQLVPGDEVTLTPIDEETREPKGRPAGIVSDMTISVDLATNYYVYCMTHTLNHRLFDDFDADSCVIIKNPAAFCSLVREAMQEKLPNWIEWDQGVHYIDPYLHSKEVEDLVFSKHFRYWYQQEYRFAWMPDVTRGLRRYTDLDPIFVEVGSLASIAELVCL